MEMKLRLTHDQVKDITRAARLARSEPGEWAVRQLEMAADLSLREPPELTDEELRAFLEEALSVL